MINEAELIIKIKSDPKLRRLAIATIRDITECNIVKELIEKHNLDHKTVASMAQIPVHMVTDAANINFKNIPDGLVSFLVSMLNDLDNKDK